MTDVLIRRGNQDTGKEKPVRTHREKTVCKPRREASGEINPSHTFSLDFWPPELGKNEFLLLEPIRLGDFVTTVLEY